MDKYKILQELRKETAKAKKNAQIKALEKNAAIFLLCPVLFLAAVIIALINTREV